MNALPPVLAAASATPLLSRTASHRPSLQERDVYRSEYIEAIAEMCTKGVEEHSVGAGLRSPCRAAPCCAVIYVPCRAAPCCVVISGPCRAALCCTLPTNYDFSVNSIPYSTVDTPPTQTAPYTGTHTERRTAPLTVATAPQEGRGGGSATHAACCDRCGRSTPTRWRSTNACRASTTTARESTLPQGSAAYGPVVTD